MEEILIETDLHSCKGVKPEEKVTPAWGGAGMGCGVDAELTKKDVSFVDVLSEDLAKELQLKEEDTSKNKLLNESELFEKVLGNSSDNTDNDFMLAQMLQYEFDKEYDTQIQREEKHHNKNSNVCISYDKYKVCPNWYDSDDDEINTIDDDENRALDSFETRERLAPVIGACGYSRHNNRIITKHDSEISGRKNAQRIFNFPPEVNTGDAGGFDMHLSNKVYNKLQRSAMSETKRKQRVHDKMEKATAEVALDPKTRLLIFKMVNSGVLEGVNGAISTGKEAAVFHAFGGCTEEESFPNEVVLKVFKTTLTDFKNRQKYIRGDYRFKDKLNKTNNKKTIVIWAEKEFHNLRRLQKGGIRSPTPLLVRKHILLMSFIGEGQRAAPKLRHVRMGIADWSLAYEEVVEGMVRMFQVCRLVHADMSEYNILYHDGHCWFIDLGQAVEPDHPHALLFLHRDCQNVISFFQSKGLPNLPTPSKLFEKVTGIKLTDDEEPDKQIEKLEVQQELIQDRLNNTSDQFEYLWEQIHAQERLDMEGKEELNDDEDDESNIITEVDEYSNINLDTHDCSRQTDTSSDKRTILKFDSDLQSNSVIPQKLKQKVSFNENVVITDKSGCISGRKRKPKGNKKSQNT